ncbi:hypothetical protein [Deinococcus pimensis]|uniref:hypothetical protein n=1 Tax=Deinococcus pimensis TaxID=309888 RepID=UPI00048144AC|nr:hypothetical protein [Deinococcus pimensis]
MNQKLQQTLDAASGGLTSIDPQAAASNVRNWVSTLQGSNVPGGDDLVSDLSTLADRLESGNLDGVGSLLARIGQTTNSLADNAPAEDADGLRQLGQALTQEGSQIQ